MHRPIPLAAVSLLLMLENFASAQEQRLAELVKVGYPTPEGSVAWFAHGFERVDAKMAFDTRSAWTDMEVLLAAAARRSAPRGAESAANALAGLVQARLEGAVVAKEWLARTETIVDDADDTMKVYYLLSRARSLCAVGEHAAEFELAIPGQKLADALGNPVLIARAILTTMHATPKRGIANANRVFAEIQQAGHGAEVEFLRPWVLAEDCQAHLQTGHRELGLKMLAELDAVAKQQGNVRIQSFVAATRANVLCIERDLEGAIRNYTAALACNERLGDVDERAAIRDMMAWTAVQRREYDEAERWLQEADELVAGRGLEQTKRALLQTRLTLAVHRRDGDAAAALSKELEDRAAATRQHELRIAEFRAGLERAEAQRDAAETELQQARQRDALSERETRLQLGAVAFVALTLLTVTTLRSRRRLQRVNAALATQVHRVEEARLHQTKLEERLRQSERTEVLSTLSAGIAHDFNNLLTSILGNAELLRHELRPGVGTTMLDNLFTSSRQAARLCKQLQIYAGGSPPAAAPITVWDSIAELLPVLRSATLGVVELAPSTSSEPIGAFVDRVQLEQVLLNLVVNANDAGATKVMIRVDAVDRVDDVRGPAARIEVRDNGGGMKPEIVQRIFDPFFTTRFPGRGLGLAVVHGIIRRHGGTVTVSSQVGSGTTFVIHLPCTAELEPGVEPTVVLQPSSRQQAVLLVVDDDDGVRCVLSQLLAGLGHEVVLAETGPALLDALDNVPADRPVVVFADLGMPGMDGQEVLREVRRRRPSARRVLMSGHPTDYIQRVASDVAPDRVISKPFRRDALRLALRQLLGPSTPRTSLEAGSTAIQSSEG